MKTEEEIKRKRDALKELLENEDINEEIMGVKQRAMIVRKINVLDWVLDENKRGEGKYE